jgi:hypothetical protein
MKQPFKILDRKPESTKLLDIPRSKWDDNIKNDLKGIGLESWTNLAPDRSSGGTVVKMVMDCQVQWKTGNLFTSSVRNYQLFKMNCSMVLVKRTTEIRKQDQMWPISWHQADIRSTNIPSDCNGAYKSLFEPFLAFKGTNTLQHAIWYFIF